MNCVLITPAHNEEAFIEKTIRSVVNQTVQPLKWVVVNDASTDRTREIVERYASKHSFIKLVNVNRPAGRHFGNKVRAFKHGLDRVDTLKFDYIGNLDADISFQPTYLASVLAKFREDPGLGIAGGMVHTRLGTRYVSQEVALDSVAGAIQMFRRSCFEQIGGYLELPNGGIDAAAEITARMKGWRVRTFAELEVLEHRLTGTALDRPLMSRVREGRRLHSLGYGFMFFFLRCLYRSMEPPKIVGSAAAIYGYLKSVIRGEQIVLPADAVKYLKGEQRSKILRAFGLSPERRIDAWV